MTPQQKEKLARTAAKAGIGISECLRRMIDKLKIIEKPSAEVSSLLVEIRKVGTNLNQIARALNAKGFFILSSIFTAAVQWQFIPSNPCARVKPPRRHKAEAIYLEEEDIFRLLKCLDSVEFMYKVLINLYIFTGMRRGEALGLTWQDIRFDKNLIDINKELVYVHESGVQVDSPKNEYSKRVIKVPPSLMELLRKLQQEQEENQKLYGDKYESSGFVFTNKLGQAASPGYGFRLVRAVHQEK